jgi:hypothetical protein
VQFVIFAAKDAVQESDFQPPPLNEITYAPPSLRWDDTAAKIQGIKSLSRDAAVKRLKKYPLQGPDPSNRLVFNPFA